MSKQLNPWQTVGNPIFTSEVDLGLNYCISVQSAFMSACVQIL